MVQSAKKTARTVKRVVSGARKVKRQAAKKVKAASKAVSSRAKRKVSPKSKALRKAAEVIGAALGKTVGRIEKALK